MKRFKLINPTLCLLGAAGLTWSCWTNAQVVELSPGYIDGEVQVGDYTIYSMWITASSGLFTAEQYFSPESVVAPYSLTVQVEEGSSRDYSVNARIVTGSQTQMTLQNRVVTVEPSETTSLDFIVLDPTIVEASIQTVNGGFANWRVFAYEVGGDNDRATGYKNVGAGTTNDAMAFPMGDSSQVRCYGYVWQQNGAQTALPNIIANFVDGVAECDWTVEFPETGTLSGTVEYSGDVPVYQYSLNLNGTTTRWISQYSPFVGPGNRDEFTVTDLFEGNYKFNSSYARMYDSYWHFFYFPDSAFLPSQSGIPVGVGDNTEIEISSCQAYAAGHFLPSGSTNIDDVSYGEIRFRPDYSAGSATRGGQSRNQFDSSTGQYLGMLSNGPWYRLPETYVVYYRPYDDVDGYLSQNMTVYPGTYLPGFFIEPECGETLPLDHEMPTGRVTINFSTADSTVFSFPRVGYGNCQYNDPETGDRLYNFSMLSSTNGSEFVDVSEASVTLEAPDGVCNNLRAQAYVNGTLTTFAEIDDLQFESGVTVIQDIGGPSLTPIYPEPELIVDANEVTVNGVVTDDVDIAFVTVNGVSATLESTGNNSDPVEMSFTATIPLPVKGPNELTYYAEDSSGKSTETSYVIFNDGAPPVIDLLPANGLVTADMFLDVDVMAADDAGIASLTVSVDGTQLYSLEGNGALDVSVIEPYSFEIGHHTIVAVATDISNRMTSATHQIEIIDNSPPTVSAEGPWSVDEGSSVQLTAQANDPDGDALTVSWDLDGDGAFDDANGLTVTFDAALLDGNGAYSVAVQVVDEGGLSDSDASTVSVANVDPEPGAVLVPLDPVALGGEVSVSVSFEDAGIPDTHNVTWNWDDGSSSAGTVVESDGSGEATGTHTYSAPGIYRVSCVVTDDDGGEATCEAEAYVVVYDPSGGFVTGGGHIQSQAGAYFGDPSLEGKAHFGFVAKYKKGQSTPSGQTEFQFKAGDLNFHSSSYEWLVVAGHRAQFKGEGSINGEAGFGFMLTAVDGKLTPSSDDAFRIRVWKLSDESDVYDNKLGADDQSDDLTELENGSIVIHKK